MSAVVAAGNEGTLAQARERMPVQRTQKRALIPSNKFVHAVVARLYDALAPAHPRVLLLTFMALFLASGVHAQNGRIQIEVLVFAYNNPDSGSALSPADADPVYTGMLLGEGGGIYSALPREALKLGGAYDALARNARTRALLHVGWQQDAGSTRAVRLRGRETITSSDPERGVLASANPELDGDLELRFGRGIEIHADALLRVATRDRAGRTGNEQRFRLNSKRIVNYGELHYIDHPALGIVVRIDRLDDAATDTASALQ